jgi:hypothetical protein
MNRALLSYTALPNKRFQRTRLTAVFIECEAKVEGNRSPLKRGVRPE